MEIVAESKEHLSASLAKANAAGEKIHKVDLRQLNRVLEHTPEDLTITIETGLTLSALQAHLAQRRQWLPIDPPAPQQTSIWDLLKFNLSGPRRYGYGTIREHLIGLKVALADGRLVKSGGKVVKNVAGYDLLKLFVGDGGTLGVAVEATFKVQPLPETEKFVQREFTALAEAGKCLEAIVDSPLTPVVLDLHGSGTRAWIVLAFAGTREDVAWSLNEAAKLNLGQEADTRYTETLNDHDVISVLPSRVIDSLEQLQAAQFICRAGNGVIYYRGAKTIPSTGQSPHELMQRIKDTFDPKHVLPDLGAEVRIQ
jgi:FAD/FMN-containing dehydrogenase